jgi:hypothetical protein
MAPWYQLAGGIHYGLVVTCEGEKGTSKNSLCSSVGVSKQLYTSGSLWQTVLNTLVPIGVACINLYKN